MEVTNFHLILLINFFHFLSGGVVIPSISPHIIKLGGNQIILGSLQSAVFIAHKISRDFMELFESSKQIVIVLSLYCCFICFTMLTFITVWWVVILLRISYALTAQVLPFSKELIAKAEPKSKKIKIRNLLDMMRVAGLSLGSIAGGIIFEYTKDFTYNAAAGSVIAFLCILLVHFINYNDRELIPSESQIFTYRQSCFQQLNNLRETDLREDLTNVFLKLSFVTTFIVYFSRFAFILIYNYHVKAIVIGCTRAYYVVLLFIFNTFVPFIKEQSQNKRKLLEKAMLISIFSLLAHCYAPTYRCYMICYIPLLCSYTLILSLLEEDVLEMKDNINIHRATETIGIIVNIVVPISYGIIRYMFGAKITKLMTLLPVVFSAYVLNACFLYPKRKHKKVEEDDSAVLY